jgi:hypothetical protein
MSNEFFDYTFENERNRLVKALRLMDRLGACYSDGDAAGAEKAEDQLVRIVQRSAIYVRDLARYNGNVAVNEYLSSVYEESFHITVDIEPEGWVKVVLPRLLPKKIRGLNQWFLRDPLTQALDAFFKQFRVEHGYWYRVNKCVISIVHCYDSKIPETQYRDHDNYEINGVIDSIAEYTMEDDEPLKCFHFYMTRKSDQSFTEIYVLPQNDFLRWVSTHVTSNLT